MRADRHRCKGLQLARLLDSYSICEGSLVAIDGTPARTVMIREFRQEFATGEILIEVEDVDVDGEQGRIFLVPLLDIAAIPRH